jgi:nitroreductase
MDMQALEKLIKERRSIRKWKRDEVPDELLKKAVELATWAPNGGNFQGWRFMIVKNRRVIEEMAHAVQSVMDKIASWPEAALWEEDIRRFQRSASFFKDAPVCIGVLTTEYQSVTDRVLIARESFDHEAKEILGFRRSAPSAIQSIGAAVATMLLVFHHMGLGSVWLAGPLQAKRAIEKILSAPPSLALVCLVAVGYSDESPQKARRPVDEVLKFVY